MMHWLVVGHFDPLDPIDKSEKPYRPKPLRPIPRESAEQAVADFGPDIDNYLSYGDGGCVYCNWSLAPHEMWERVHDFANFLAEREQAVVIDENYMARWPADARQRQQRAWGWGQEAEPGAAPDRGVT